jgi:hypothetical protein
LQVIVFIVVVLLHIGADTSGRALHDGMRTALDPLLRSCSIRRAPYLDVSAATAACGSGTVTVTVRPLRRTSLRVGLLWTVQEVRFGVHQNPHETRYHARSITSTVSISSSP